MSVPNRSGMNQHPCSHSHALKILERRAGFFQDVLPWAPKNPASCRPLALDFGRSKVPLVWLVLIWHDSTTHPHLANMFVSFDRSFWICFFNLDAKKIILGNRNPKTNRIIFLVNSFSKHYPSKKKNTLLSLFILIFLLLPVGLVQVGSH